MFKKLSISYGDFRFKKVIIIGLVGLMGIFLLLLSDVQASRVDELKNKIEEHSQQVTKLEKEIAEYEQKLNEIANKRQSLENAIERLNVVRKKVLTDIKLTQNKIDNKKLEIKQLNNDIEGKKQQIDKAEYVLSKAIRNMNALESRTLVEALFAYEDLGRFWSRLDNLERFQITLRSHLKELENLKKDLEENLASKKRKQEELLELRRELYERKKSLDIARREKNQLLKQTQNKESNYQQILERKRKRKAQFEKELRHFEAKLEIAVNADKIPETSRGLLEWPVRNVYVTQYFGDTPFATQNAQVYSGSGHTGVDLRASIGTPVKAAMTGKVQAVGNTDRTCAGASYGKWVLLEHGNGLSTLYAHLSEIGVSKSQEVSMGETIGYSGNSGYCTGPHLHFGVYATQGVRVSKLKSKACRGAVYTLPMADFDAYLNPMSYLPQK